MCVDISVEQKSFHNCGIFVESSMSQTTWFYFRDGLFESTNGTLEVNHS